MKKLLIGLCSAGFLAVFALGAAFAGGVSFDKAVHVSAPEHPPIQPPI
ncbi:hypothetical protein [Bacillus sp. T33-2]|nr:hypothetical protein [Bacillus sp. T33-2]